MTRLLLLVLVIPALTGLQGCHAICEWGCDSTTVETTTNLASTKLTASTQKDTTIVSTESAGSTAPILSTTDLQTDTTRGVTAPTATGPPKTSLGPISGSYEPNATTPDQEKSTSEILTTPRSHVNGSSNLVIVLTCTIIPGVLLVLGALGYVIRLRFTISVRRRCGEFEPGFDQIQMSRIRSCSRGSDTLFDLSVTSPPVISGYAGRSQTEK